MIVDILLIAGGLALLFFGGEALLKGSVSIAKNLGLSNLLVSAVVVGFGTSMPELTVSLGAALKGSSDIALGNIVGSNIANIMLILALCCVIFPVTVRDHAVTRDAVMVFVASIILCALTLFDAIGRIEGAAIFTLLVGYIIFCVWSEKKSPSPHHADTAEQTVQDSTPAAEPSLKPLPATVFVVVGLALLVTGASFLVDGATDLARLAGVPEAVIGLTLVAVGTSLPELATGVIAALRKHGDVIIGNILGSNFFNILGILGVTAMITPITINSAIASFDVWIMLGTAVLTLAFAFPGRVMGRLFGAILLVGYATYVVYLYTQM